MSSKVSNTSARSSARVQQQQEQRQQQQLAAKLPPPPPPPPPQNKRARRRSPSPAAADADVDERCSPTPEQPPAKKRKKMATDVGDTNDQQPQRTKKQKKTAAAGTEPTSKVKTGGAGGKQTSKAKTGGAGGKQTQGSRGKRKTSAQKAEEDAHQPEPSTLTPVEQYIVADQTPRAPPPALPVPARAAPVASLPGGIINFADIMNIQDSPERGRTGKRTSPSPRRTSAAPRTDGPQDRRRRTPDAPTASRRSASAAPQTSRPSTPALPVAAPATVPKSPAVRATTLAISPPSASATAQDIPASPPRVVPPLLTPAEVDVAPSATLGRAASPVLPATTAASLTPVAAVPVPDARDRASNGSSAEVGSARGRRRAHGTVSTTARVVPAVQVDEPTIAAVAKIYSGREDAAPVSVRFRTPVKPTVGDVLMAIIRVDTALLRQVRISVRNEDGDWDLIGNSTRLFQSDEQFEYWDMAPVGNKATLSLLTEPLPPVAQPSEEDHVRPRGLRRADQQRSPLELRLLEYVGFTPPTTNAEHMRDAFRRVHVVHANITLIRQHEADGILPPDFAGMSDAAVRYAHYARSNWTKYNLFSEVPKDSDLHDYLNGVMLDDDKIIKMFGGKKAKNDYAVAKLPAALAYARNQQNARAARAATAAPPPAPANAAAPAEAPLPPPVPAGMSKKRRHSPSPSQSHSRVLRVNGRRHRSRSSSHPSRSSSGTPKHRRGKRHRSPSPSSSSASSSSS